MSINLFSTVKNKKNHKQFEKCIFYGTFGTCFFCLFSRFNDEKTRCKYYYKRTTIRDNSNFQSFDQEESKLDSTIIAKSGAHTLIDDESIKSPINKNNIATIKNK